MGAAVAGAAGAGAAPRAGAARTGSRPPALLAAHPATCDAVADLLGCDGTWEAPAQGPAGAVLAARHPDTAEALEALLAGK